MPTRSPDDAIVGDGTLFAGQDGVDAAWALFNPSWGWLRPFMITNPARGARPKPRSSRRVSVAATARSGCYPRQRRSMKMVEWLEQFVGRGSFRLGPALAITNTTDGGNQKYGLADNSLYRRIVLLKSP